MYKVKRILLVGILVIIPKLIIAQDLQRGLDLDNEDIKEITTKSFFIEKNKEDTIYIKRDFVSHNLKWKRTSKHAEPADRPIIFVPEEYLYNNLIYDYYVVLYVREDYDIVRIGYIQYNTGKLVEIILYKNRQYKWEILKKSVSDIGKIRYRDYVHKLIGEEIAKKNRAKQKK